MKSKQNITALKHTKKLESLRFIKQELRKISSSKSKSLVISHKSLLKKTWNGVQREFTVVMDPLDEKCLRQFVTKVI